MSQEPAIVKTGSPFLSLFRSKKKLNTTKSSDDIKARTSPVPDQTIERPRKLSFTDRVKAHKTARANKKMETSNTLPDLFKKKNKHGLFDQGKSQSFDALIEEDPIMLVESLQTLADDQPLVARSIPKHAKISNKKRDPLQNCLFEQEVYDTMLSDSLKVCDLLTSHLDDCIIHVRAKSPEFKMNLSDDGRDSGRGPSSASSTISTSPTIQKRPLKSCVRADL